MSRTLTQITHHTLKSAIGSVYDVLPVLPSKGTVMLVRLPLNSTSLLNVNLSTQLDRYIAKLPHPETHARGKMTGEKEKFAWRDDAKSRF